MNVKNTRIQILKGISIYLYAHKAMAKVYIIKPKYCPYAAAFILTTK